MERRVRMRWWMSALVSFILAPSGLIAAFPANGDLTSSFDPAQADVDIVDAGPATAAALADVVTQCLPRLSLDCAQWRMAGLIRYLDAMPQFPLLEGLVYVVRVGTDATQPRPASVSRDADSDGGGGDGSRHLEAAVADFFERHVLRLQLPMWFGDTVRPKTVDFALKPETDAGSARKKKGKGDKKGMKKMMMMICMMMMGKMMMVMPMVLTIIKLKAIKALLIGSLALLISKIQLVKKLLGSKVGGGGGGGSDKHVIVLHADSHGGGGHGGGGPSGGGGDWSSGGGGGGGGGWMSSGGGGGGDWSSRGADFRSIDDAHELAYRGQVVSSGWSASQPVTRR
ncbi:uncharacterized protein LOC126354629 [Schistocerca gregaria]|uniref:uncharacterized protein LOC126354629 n=1 Tax=Schistocerca gregaria TaxID=7010 RepID=UPI00211EA696|nr:uncharacterized protein LOC126354629 [Schistocerca gregaria]